MYTISYCSSLSYWSIIRLVWFLCVHIIFPCAVALTNTNFFPLLFIETHCVSHCQSGKLFILAFKNLSRSQSFPFCSLSPASPHHIHLLQPNWSLLFWRNQKRPSFSHLMASHCLSISPSGNPFLPSPPPNQPLSSNPILSFLLRMSFLTSDDFSSSLSEWFYNLFPEFLICHIYNQ